MSNPTIFTILDIYELFCHVFSSVHLVEKLLFKRVSIKCKKMIEKRLLDKLICDDFDEYTYLKKDKRFDTKFRITVNISNYNNELLLDAVVKNNSIMFLKRLISDPEQEHNVCCNSYFIYLSMITNKNITDNYKLLVNKHVLNTDCDCDCDYSGKKKIVYVCSKIINLCLENDFMPPDNFYNGLNSNKIFNLMVRAGCHGSYNMFTNIYNYLKTNNYNFNQHILMVLICYYKYYYENIYSNATKKKLFIETNNHKLEHDTNRNYDKILKWWTKAADSEKYIFNNVKQETIENIFMLCVGNDEYTSAEYFLKYINNVSSRMIKKVFSNMNHDGTTINLFKNVLIKKYGDLSIQNVFTSVETELKLCRYSMPSYYDDDHFFLKFYSDIYVNYEPISRKIWAN